MKISLIFISLFVTICGFSQKEEDIVKKQPQPPFIEVTGTAIKEVAPDKIYIAITLSDKVVNNQPYTITAQEDKLKKALTKNNIDLDNLSLSDASSEITKYRNKETGFRITKEYILLVSNATQVSDVFKELYAINIREATVERAERSDIEMLRKQVRIAAIQAAKDKADYLVKAIGEELGKPLEIHEETDIPYFRNLLSNTSVTENDADANKLSEPTNFQKFTIKFSYYIRYAIK